MIHLLTEHPKFCEKWGISAAKGLKYIDSGTFGSTYSIDSGHNIIKITSDRKEALTSAYVMSKRLNNFVWNIFFVGKDPHNEFKSIYYIIGEKLKPLGGDFNKLDNVRDGIFYWYNSKDSSLMKSRDINDFFRLNKDWLDNHSPDWKEIYKKNKKQANWFYEALKAIGKAGIDWEDHHPGNIMKKGDSWRFIDLGLSKSPAGKLQIVESTFI